jgi:O-antigen ligase
MRTDESEVPTLDELPVAPPRRQYVRPLPEGLRTFDVAVCGLALLLCVAFLPIFVTSSSTPRLLVLLGAVPFGLVAVQRLVRSGDPAAVALAALVAWAAVSALLSNNTVLALKGGIGRESSVVILAGVAGTWALGRGLSPLGRRWLAITVLAGFALNAAVGLFQVLLQIESGTLPLVSSRPTGLTPNPVYFGALMAAGVAMSAWPLATTRRPVLAAVSVAAFTTMVHLSGTRIAVAAALVTVGYVAVRHRSGRGWYVVPAVLAGTVVAWVVNATVGGAASAIDRIDEQSGSGGRFAVWRYGLDALWDAPVAGHGTGRFRAAVQGRYTSSFSAGNTAFDSQWFDAHNIVVEVAVTLGVVGLVLFAAFAVLSVRTARGPLAVGVVAIAITWLLEPAALATLPLAMLALGASHAGASTVVPTTSRARTTALATAAALLMGWTAITDLRLQAAIDSGNPARIEDAAAWLWRDPIANDLVTQSWVRAAMDGEAPMSRAVEASERTIAYEDDRAGWWERKAAVLLLSRDLDGARSALERTLELQPWRPSAWQLMEAVASNLEDDALEREALARLCALRMPECDGDPGAE